MGRRMKLSQLDEQECQWVLGVIHRDFDLRHREQQRLNKIERELNEAANQRNLLAKRKEFNEKCCILCCATFNLLFNKRLLCTQCQLFICRNCATWESQEKKWLCRVCEQQRVLYVQSCEWFYDHIKQRFKHFGSAKVLDTLRRKRKESGVDSENDSGYGPATEGHSMKSSPLSFLLPLQTGDRTKPHQDDNAPIQPGHSNGEEEEEDTEESSEVRRHIETVVQGLIGENLDTARVDKPYTHPQYHQLFSSFHAHLVDAITKLCQALDVALNNKPEKRSTPPSANSGTCSSSSSSSEVTPTTAHAALKQCILDVAHQAASLPSLKETPDSSPEAKQNGGDFISSCLFHSYQELLASAIINKLVEQSQKRFSPNQRLRREDSELSDSDTDILMNSAPKDGVCSDQSVGSESESLDTESSLGGVDAADDEFTWAKDIRDSDLPPRIEYVIEERIEEITEEEITDADGNHHSSNRHKEERVHRPLHRSVSRQKSVDDPVTRATFEVPSGNSVPDLDFLNAWDLVESRRVPFPEFGVDIVEDRLWDENGLYYDGGQEEEEEEEDEEFDSVGSRRSSVTAWEENWLFRKRKLFPYGGLRHQLLGFYGEPPCMLIPNPRDGPSSHPQIDARDVDQLSELSEHNSIGSLDFTDSESESEFRGSQKLVELAQNVAHHFNSSSLNSGALYQNSSELKVTKTRELELESKPSVDSVRSNQKTRRLEPPLNGDEHVSVPKYVSPSQRTAASHDPYFSIAPESVSLHAGKVASFQCQVKGTKPLGVAWFIGDRLIQPSECIEMFQREKDCQYFLNIYDTETNDSGIYSCVVFGRNSESWADFNLQVKGTSRAMLPPEFVVPLRLSERGEYDRSVQLTCTLSGYPEPRLLLFHNKHPVAHSSKHTIECLGYGEWRLQIHGMESSDEGEYEAYASNRLGHSLSTLHLTQGDAILSKVDTKISRHTENVKERKNSEVRGHWCQKPVVIQRTWWERCAEMEPNGKPNRFLLEPLERKPMNGPVDLSPPSPAPCDLSCPPRPGTIAEREHRKWETAVPLANNPYSAENITKRRLERRISDVSLTSPSMTFEEFERQRELNNTSMTLKTERYCRDYYVNDPDSCNSSLSRGDRRNSGILHDGMCEESLTALQDKVYLSADKVSSLEGQVRLLERELEIASAPNHLDQLQSQVVRAAAQVNDSSREVSRVENEVRRLRKTLSSDSSQSDVLPVHKISALTSEDEGEEPCSLPSVKLLANLFTPANSGLSNNANDNHNLNGMHMSKVPYPEKEVVIVDSSLLTSVSTTQPPIQQAVTQSQPKYKVANQVAPPPPAPLEEERANKEKVWPLVRQLSRSFDNNNNNNNDSGNNAASVQRVHSLTARSLSKEFRQQAARHMPRPMNRTVSVVSPSSSCSSSQPTSLDTERSASPLNTTPYNSNNNLSLPPSASVVDADHHRHASENAMAVSGGGGGYTSDESSASNTSLPRPTKRRPISKAILQRANYWERRAEQGLLSDNSVSEEFPIVRKD